MFAQSRATTLTCRTVEDDGAVGGGAWGTAAAIVGACAIAAVFALTAARLGAARRPDETVSEEDPWVEESRR